MLVISPLEDMAASSGETPAWQDSLCTSVPFPLPPIVEILHLCQQQKACVFKPTTARLSFAQVVTQAQGTWLGQYWEGLPARAPSGSSVGPS